MKRFFITGTAGFIGFHLARRLLEIGHEVSGLDGFTPYYDLALKRRRHAVLEEFSTFRGHNAMLEDFTALSQIVADAKPQVIIHLAAQAGVRYSLENPRAYVDSNLTGTFNVLECAKSANLDHLLIASSSSVYGANAQMPSRETDRTDHPLTLYAASKKAGEDMAHAYAHLFRIPTTAFRFFTVYGPWGRPDMALFKFVTATLNGEPVDVFGQGAMTRDFTYIDDLVEAILRLIACPPGLGEPIGPFDSLSPAASFRVVNTGGGQPVGLLALIHAIEATLGVGVRRRLLPMQKGDAPATCASTDLLQALTGYAPSTPIEVGVARFFEWYREFYGASHRPLSQP